MRVIPMLLPSLQALCMIADSIIFKAKLETSNVYFAVTYCCGNNFIVAYCVSEQDFGSFVVFDYRTKKIVQAETPTGRSVAVISVERTPIVNILSKHYTRR